MKFAQKRILFLLHRVNNKQLLYKPITIREFTLKHNDNSNKGNDKSKNAIEVKEKKPSIALTIKNVIIGLSDSTIDLIKNPKKAWELTKETVNHYWLGTKLLWSEIKLSSQILKRVLQGHLMTRRERIQLIRTTKDIFRLVPFSVFIIVPFMEFLLPFALKLFPNMLPSTFQDNLKKEETMKKELQMRLAVAGFLQDTLKEMADRKTNSSTDKSGAKEVIEFIEKARVGEDLPNDKVIRIAQYFKDELTLANIARPQLVSLCQYMNLTPYGADAFLRFQIRNKIRLIKEDDRRILWEGINALTIEELREACQERGMRSIGLTHFGYKRQLQDWLELSIQKNIPISLLIMSRAFNISKVSFEAEEVLKSSISSLTDETINEVVLAAANQDEENSSEIKKRKLESIQFQKEMIEDEREDQDELKLKIQQKSVSVKENVTAVSPKNESKDIQSSDKIANLSDIQKKPVDKKLSVPEIEAIGDLARDSSVDREKAELAIMQAYVESTHSSYDSSLEKSVEIDEESTKHVKSVLSAMLNKLKIKIDTTEKELGDKLKMLDQDRDGELSSAELKNAIVKILKRVSSDSEADEIVKYLDSDKDGKVSVIELLQYVESRKQKLEVENFEERLKILDTNNQLK